MFLGLHRKLVGRPGEQFWNYPEFRTACGETMEVHQSDGIARFEVRPGFDGHIWQCFGCFSIARILVVDYIRWVQRLSGIKTIALFSMAGIQAGVVR